MKKFFFILLLSILFFNTPVFAHSPSDIILEVEGKTIIVTIDHLVSDNKMHYIGTIIVRKNGRKIIQQIFLSQSKKEQRALYYIPSLTPGDKIEIEAYCNQSGKMKKNLLIN